MKRDMRLKITNLLATLNTDFHQMRVAIIGGTGGIGQALSRLLATHGAQVLVVEQTFRDAGFNSNINFIKADLSSMYEAQRIAPLLLSPDIEKYSGAMFNNKVQAILPTPGLSAEYITPFMDNSRALIAKTGIYEAKQSA
jgi:NAD(P)-dependent dehydrogenase (short-subunit alcohol dehydrogenase family)